MTTEIRVLYIAIIATITVCLLMLASTERALGAAEGKLSKMEEFKTNLMPSPDNVFPDAEKPPEYPEAE